MLMNHTIKELENIAKEICIKYNLRDVYFTQKYGKRKHFLAGHGKISFGLTYHVNIDDNITLSWEGDMTEKKALETMKLRKLILDHAEQELSRH